MDHWGANKKWLPKGRITFFLFGLVGYAFGLGEVGRRLGWVRLG